MCAIPALHAQLTPAFASPSRCPAGGFEQLIPINADKIISGIPVPGGVAAPSAALSLTGPDTICAGSSASLSIAFFDGTAPYTFVYSINGMFQSPITTNSNPFDFITPLLSSGTAQIKLDSVAANGEPGAVSGDITVTVLAVPVATLFSDTVSICSGQTDTLRILFSGAGPYTFQYAANKDTMPPVTTPDTLVKIPVSPAPGFTNYTLVNVTAGGCNGVANGSYGISVTQVPTASLSGDTVICAGSPTALVVNFTGSAPFIVNYTANNVPQPPDTSFFNPRTILVTPSVPTFYQLTSVSTNGCAGSVSGQATVNVLPELAAVISGGGQICQGDTGTTITITFQGPGPYTFVFAAGLNNQPPITTSTNPFVIKVNPPIGTIYRLISVTNGSCTGTVSGQAVVAVFTPSTASLSGDLTFCNQADTTLMVDFTGSGPFELVYAIAGVAQPLVETFDDPYFIPVNINTTTQYTLISVESPGCVGMVNGQATVTINYPPSYSGLQFNCNLAAGTYTVEFDVLNAAFPITLTAGSGTFAGAHFTSNPLPVAMAYNFVFHDANNCGNITVSGASGCSCNTNAGTMNLAPVDACIGTQATANHNGNQALDSNDVFAFILHSNPALPAGQIFAWNSAPVFSFGAGMLPNVTYYISAIAGNPGLPGQVDLNDPCLSVSQGAPVIFFDLPTAAFDSIGPVCPGNNASVPVVLQGAPPFSLIYSVNGVIQPTLSNIGTTSVEITVPVAGPTTLNLVSVSDMHCTGLPADTLQLVLLQAPPVSNLLITCNYAAKSYIIEFDVSGQAPFTVSGVIGFFTGNHFSSLPISSSLPYAITVTDGNNCGQTNFNGISNCVCLTEAGTMDLTPLEACAGAAITASHNGDQTLDANDVLAYILHTNAGTVIGTVLGVQGQPIFNFNAGTMQPETTYYISAVAGDDNGSGGVDLGDPCLSVSAGTPVMWHAIPSVTLSGSFDICPGGSVTIPLAFSGTGPFTFTYNSNLQQNTVVSLQNSFSINAVLVQNTVFQAVSLTDAYCPGTAAGQTNVTVHPSPQITGINVVCAPDNLSYTVDFDVINADSGTVAITGSVAGNYDPASAHFTSDPIPAQTGYSAIASDFWMCGVDSISGGANCSCATSAGMLDQTPLTLCNNDTVGLAPASGFFLGPGDTLLYALVTTPSPLTWTILAQGQHPGFFFNPVVMTAGVPYYVVALAGNQTGSGVDFTDPCFTYSPGPSVVWQPVPSALLGTDASICRGDTATISISFTGNPPYNFVYRVNGIDQSVPLFSGAQYNLPVSPVMSSTYDLVSLAANGCPGVVSGTATVTVHPVPQILNPITTCDLATLTYTLEFAISNGSAQNPAYTVSGLAGMVLDSTFTSGAIPSGQVYTAIVATPDGCTDTLSGTATCVCTTASGSLQNTNPLSVCLPGMAVTQANNDAVLDPEDVRQYILYQNPALLPMGILAISDMPQFAFQAGMQTETIYFIAAIAGNALPSGNVDTSDPCLSISPGLPVVFHAAPTAILAGDTTICAGASVHFKIKFTGKAPFQFIYAINGNQQAGVSAPQNSFTISTSNVQQDQIFSLVSLQDAYCTGTVSGTYIVHIQQGPSAAIAPGATICNGDTATLVLLLSGADTFNVTVNGGAAPIQLNGVQNGATFSVTPAGTTLYSIGLLTALGNNCPADIGQSATVTVAPALALAYILSDYGGYNVSCPNESDGSIALNPGGGVPPLTANWAGGGTGMVLDNLPAGQYAVTLTDNIGCHLTDSFTLAAPPGLEVDYLAQSPTCFGLKDGEIIVETVQGGVGPFAIALNNQPITTTGDFPTPISGLGSGNFQLSISDINGCETVAGIELTDPPLLSVNLGPDTTIYFGDSISITAGVGPAMIDTFAWFPTWGLRDSSALTTFAKPVQSTVYHIWVQDTSGCQSQDEILITVRRDRRVYIPNALLMGAEGENGVFTVYAGPELERIKSIRVYDRWGECIFEGLGVEPNNPATGWKGQWKGKDVPPGVYIYVIDLLFFDGNSEVRSGEVTVLH